jgi:hypothetical protein
MSVKLLKLSGGHAVKVFENSKLRRIFGPKWN